MVQLTDKIWAVELPEGAHHVGLSGSAIICCHPGRSVPTTGSRFPLPPGNWQFLFTTKEATWEQAESVVEKINGWYKDYGGGPNYSDPMYSLESLLVSKGCDVNKNYAIIQKL